MYRRWFANITLSKSKTKARMSVFPLTTLSPKPLNRFSSNLEEIYTKVRECNPCNLILSRSNFNVIVDDLPTWPYPSRTQNAGHLKFCCLWVMRCCVEFARSIFLKFCVKMHESIYMDSMETYLFLNLRLILQEMIY